MCYDFFIDVYIALVFGNTSTMQTPGHVEYDAERIQLPPCFRTAAPGKQHNTRLKTYTYNGKDRGRSAVTTQRGGHQAKHLYY